MFVPLLHAACLAGRRGSMAAALLLFPLSVVAVESAWLESGLVTGQGWQLEAPRVTIRPESGDRWRLEGEARALRWQQVVLERLRLSCPELLHAKSRWQCAKGRFSLRFPPLGTIRGMLSLTRQAASGTRLLLEKVRMGGALLEAKLQGVAAGWQMEWKLQKLALAPLLRWLLPQWSGSGHLDSAGAGHLGEKGWRLDGRLDGRRLGFSDPDGLRVGEQLQAGGRLVLEGGAGRLSGRLEFDLQGGQLYIDPIFADFEEGRALSLRLRLDGDPQSSAWRLDKLAVDYRGVLRVAGSGMLASGQLQKLELSFQSPSLAEAYRVLLQPLLIGTALDALTLSGQARGRLKLERGQLALLWLDMEPASLVDAEKRFAFEGLEADIDWQRGGQARKSRLRWRKGRLYRIDLGPLDATFMAAGGVVEARPFEVSVLEGRLVLQNLRIQELLTGNARWRAGATLEGIQLEALSKALGWPLLQGEMNARIPEVHYQEGRLQLDGNLVVEVFGGRVIVEGLTVEDPFGVAPVLETSLRFENLDLARISSTFSFGRIEGSLEGHVRNLRLVGWELSGFEALVRTPSRDRRKHRISQRAIDNLAELGNGVAAGLSGTFLGVFKDFSYDRLELRVSLEGDTAELDGAPGPDGGYYIVKGARLPRVDVIGRNHRVAWKDLLSRLRDIRFEGIVVE